MGDRGPTYDYSGPEKVLRKAGESPKLMEKLTEGAKGRAEDIFESGGLEQRIKKGDVVISIGSGTGHVEEVIEKRIGAKVIKLDYKDLRTPDTRDKKFVKADAERLPVQDDSVDVVCLFDILHHTTNQEQILAEALRVLKPGGKCFVLEDTIPEEINFGAGLNRLKAKAIEKLHRKQDDLFNQQPTGVNPHNLHTVSDWEIKFHDVGFNVDADKTTTWHWGVPDFMGADRKKRPKKPTVARPFPSTMFEVTKPNIVEVNG